MNLLRSLGAGFALATATVLSAAPAHASSVEATPACTSTSALTVVENSSVSFIVASDTHVSAGPPPSHGSLASAQNPPNVSVKYTPNANFVGSDSFALLGEALPSRKGLVFCFTVTVTAAPTPTASVPVPSGAPRAGGGFLSGHQAPGTTTGLGPADIGGGLALALAGTAVVVFSARRRTGTRRHR